MTRPVKNAGLSWRGLFAVSHPLSATGDVRERCKKWKRERGRIARDDEQMMGATIAVRSYISQRLSANQCSRIPFPVTLIQNRIHLSRSLFCPSTIDLDSFLGPMSLCYSSSSPSSAFTAVDVGFTRFGALRTSGISCVGVLQLWNAASLPSQCGRSFDLSTKLNFPSWKKQQTFVPELKRMIRSSKVECTSQAGASEQSSSTPSSVLPEVKTTGFGLRITFCPRCGGATEKKIPDGEHELRVVCTVCSTVHYENPKMVVGCLVEHEDQVLLCRRSIEPSYGYWTLPAGYMEIGESAAEGAARETWEEACAEVEVLGLFAHLDIPFIGQCRAT